MTALTETKEEKSFPKEKKKRVASSLNRYNQLH
jgi:hypothetical protein